MYYNHFILYHMCLSQRITAGIKSLLPQYRFQELDSGSHEHLCLPSHPASPSFNLIGLMSGNVQSVFLVFRMQASFFSLFFPFFFFETEFHSVVLELYIDMEFFLCFLSTGTNQNVSFKVSHNGLMDLIRICLISPFFDSNFTDLHLQVNLERGLLTLLILFKEVVLMDMYCSFSAPFNYFLP